MNTLELLDELQKKAMADEKIRKELLLTREQKDPLRAFCPRRQEHWAMSFMRWNWWMQGKIFMQK